MTRNPGLPVRKLDADDNTYVVMNPYLRDWLRDRDGVRRTETTCSAPVPQHRQARCVSNRPETSNDQ